MSLPIIIKDIEDRFKISGGTLTGNMEINKSNYPMIMIKDLGQGRRGEFIYNINEEVIISNYKDENNRSLLFLRSENNINNLLQLSRVVDGQWSNYNIYGEHNKPTPADIGAAVSGHTHNYAGSTSVGGAATSATTLTGLTATVAELNYVDGVTSNIQTQLNNKAASSHGNHVPTTQTANNKVFLRNDNTWQTITPANIGAAATSHGNHVPTTQTANNKVFLRNDNTWQTITPANIGAAASSHNHAASNITSGTLGVARGGTGATTFASGAALIGAGTSAVTTRAITNNTSSATLSGTNLVTANSVNYHVRNWLNRTNGVTGADTSYTTYMTRGIALVTSAPSSMTNGTCAFVYS